MFDLPLSTIIDLIRDEPGKGLVQSVLLFLIWMSAKGMKKEITEFRSELTALRATHEIRLDSLEKKTDEHGGRILVLEKGR